MANNERRVTAMSNLQNTNTVQLLLIVTILGPRVGLFTHADSSRVSIAIIQICDSVCL